MSWIDWVNLADNTVWESEEWLQEHEKKDDGEQGQANGEEAA